VQAWERSKSGEKGEKAEMVHVWCKLLKPPKKPPVCSGTPSFNTETGGAFTSLCIDSPVATIIPIGDPRARDSLMLAYSGR